MFSFTHTSNTFPSFPSSSYPPLPFYIDPDHNAFASNTTLLHDPLAVLPFMSSQAAPNPHTVTNLSSVADCTAKFLKKKPVRKDRHSKIHTSRGLRDRRVRLSSEIARKFFDLQDMLECDKPSITLEWLFTKSENAIKELARSNKHSLCSEDQEKEEVCVKARERSTSSKPARCTTLQLQILHQPHQACARYPQLLGCEASSFDDVVEESIVLKRNLKPSLLSYQQQNLVIPREATFNTINDYPLLSNSPQHWDTMNLSTELQIFGNSGEECTNQSRH